MKKGRVYNKAMIKFLTENYPKMFVGELTEEFNRTFGQSKTVKQIKSCLANHDIKAGVTRHQTPRRYQDEHLAFLQSKYLELNLEQLTDAFNAEFPKFGADVKSIRSCLKNHKIRSGRTGHFEPGQESWNKGMKGLNTGGEAGWFKKGAVPLNVKPIGHERVCSRDGYILIKVAEQNPHRPNQTTRYKHKHVHVWEQANGPVPKGMVVTFLDDDKTNCSLDNLTLASRGQMAIINKMGVGNAPKEVKKAALTYAELTIKTNEMECAE